MNHNVKRWIEDNEQDEDAHEAALQEQYDAAQGTLLAERQIEAEDARCRKEARHE